MTRLDKWRTHKKFISTFLSGKDKTKLNYVSQIQVQHSKKEYDGKLNWTSFDLIGACKELVYDIEEGKPIFHAVTYSFDTDKACIKLEPSFEISASTDSKEELADFVISILALAKAKEVPVYPNTEDLSEQLAEYYRRMLLEGSVAPDGKESRVRVMSTNSPQNEILDPEYYESLKLTDFVSPAYFGTVKAGMGSEFERLQHTSKLFVSLVDAIGTLGNLLSGCKRNENKIHKSIIENPILFGVDYIRIIPKHRLGAEYEMDYALERQSGIIDLVEIESSNLPIFNKKGDPSQYLVHAEQQVIDWISWIERNKAYTRESLPGVMGPIAYVIIGRSNNLASDEIVKLKRRNILFKGQLIIMTYDELLNRAKYLLGKLQGI